MDCDEQAIAQRYENIGIDAGPAVSIVPYFGVGFGGSGFIRFAIK